MHLVPRFLPFLLAVSGALAVLAAVVGYILGGPSAALGAAAGVVFIAVIYTLSTVFLVWVEKVNVYMMLGAGLTAYAAKLFALFVVLGAVSDTGWSGLRAMIFGVAAAALMWVVAQMWWLSHAKILYVDLGEGK